MGFVFRKCARIRTLPITKATGKKAVTLKRLRSFLDAEEPKAVKWLVTHWDYQQSSISYAELREAILAGGLTEKQLKKWQKDYAQLVNTKLAPQWAKAMTAAADERKKQFPNFLYDPGVGAAQAYIQQHGAELVTNLIAEQKTAIQAMVAQATQYNAITADSLSRIIRPVIGLTTAQAKANLKYWNAVWQSGAESGLSSKAAEKRADQMAAKYAAQQHRYRAMNIARTELAMAYNQGSYGATKDAQEQGYIGDCKKIWLTAADEDRVCSICRAIDGQSVNMDAMFSIGVLLPPAHPSCRCAVAYEEIEESLLTSAEDVIIDVQPQEPQPNIAPAHNTQTVETQTAEDSPLLTPEKPPPKPKPKLEPMKYDRYPSRSDVPKTYDEKLNSLSQTEKDALTLYTGSSYTEINGHLRHGKAVSYNITQAIQDLDRAFAQQAAEIPSNATLYRGCHPSTLDGWDALVKKPLAEWTGQTLSDKAFISTSIVSGSNFSGDVILTIKAPQGTRGIFVSPISHYKSENEVLLNRGTTFRIDGATRDASGTYRLDVTVVSDAATKKPTRNRKKPQSNGGDVSMF